MTKVIAVEVTPEQSETLRQARAKVRENRAQNGLKPCPFCGAKQNNASIVIVYRNTLEDVETKAFNVRCLDCRASTLTSFVMLDEHPDDAKERAIRRWNSRA